MVKTGTDNLVYYIAETPGWGSTTETVSGIGDGDNTPDNGTWSPLLEVQSISGRVKNREKKSVYRHGRRKRVKAVLGKTDPEDLVFELFMVDDNDFTFSIDATGNTVTFADDNPDTITRASGSWITDGLQVGDSIAITDSTSNNFTYTIETISALVLTLKSTDAVVAEVNTTTTIVFTVESLNFYDIFLTGGNDFDDTFNAELTPYSFLIPDNVLPASADDFEYYYGCVLKEVEVTISEADPNILLTATFDVQSYDFNAAEQHASVSTIYASPPVSVTYLLWSDVVLAKANFTTNATVTSIQELTFTVNQNYTKIWTINNVSFASFNVAEGYEASGSLTALNQNLTEFWDEEQDLDGDITIAITRTTSPIAITIDECVFDSISLDSAPNELQTLDADFTATVVTFA